MSERPLLTRFAFPLSELRLNIDFFFGESAIVFKGRPHSVDRCSRSSKHFLLFCVSPPVSSSMSDHCPTTMTSSTPLPPGVLCHSPFPLLHPLSSTHLLRISLLVHVALVLLVVFFGAHHFPTPSAVLIIEVVLLPFPRSQFFYSRSRQPTNLFFFFFFYRSLHFPLHRMYKFVAHVQCFMH
jgi:hypothetical protein